jgi:V8-like Glu-specific endopeptidase
MDNASAGVSVVRRLFSRHATAAASAAIAAFSALSMSALSAAAAEPARSGPRLPDFASYGCADAAATTPAHVVHKGQVIEGRYHEWHELYADVKGARRLACISLVTPRAEQLSLEAARQFLNASLGIGQPPANAKARAQGADVEQLTEPDNVRPEPLRRVTPDSPSRAAPERGAQSAPNPATEAPPLPASKEADPDEIGATPIMRERGSALPEQNFSAEQESPAAVGVDDRQRVGNTLTYPWNTVGYLSVTYPNGQSFRCTGTLVSPYVVLTAGHCVHNKNRGGYASQVRFYPAQYQNNLGDNQPQRPYGKQDFAFIRATEAWTQISDQDSYPVTEYRHDFAAVQFRTPFTFTGTFMPVIFGSVGAPATGTGYPGVVQGVSNYGQWWDEGADTSSSFMRNSHVKQYAVDGSGGNSGGPFFTTDAVTGQNALVGALSYGDEVDDRSGGPWYDSWNRTLLTSWMNWTPAAASTGNLGGLRVPGVFSSNHPNLFSYLRFYNGDATPGTVEITISDGTSGQPLGTWTSPTIAPFAMKQVGMRDLESQVALPANKPNFYSLSIRPTFSGYFQHAMWEPYMRSLTNLTSCDTGAAAQAGIVMGVHSTRIEGYPSSVVVHNTSTSSANYSLGVYDGRNGAMLGTYQTGLIPANGQRVVSAATLQTNSFPAFQPVEADQAHYVVKPLSSSFTGYLQHYVHNESVDTIADVTALCRLTP